MAALLQIKNLVFLKNSLYIILAAWFPIQLDSKSYISSFAISLMSVPSFFSFNTFPYAFMKTTSP